ncbi:MAG: CAP domain-containing protein [Bacteroidetes bacterium]|nr:CAP domain-containing protein [Bacteroidota bacterium]
MKKVSVVFWLFFFSANFVIAQESLRFQTVDMLRLRGVFKQTATDTVMKIERLAALKFHTLLNAYRRENKLDTLRFNDTLWLASRNHNIWMIANKQLSHSEEKDTPSFTGEDPGDRYEFVAKDKANCSWTGENCLYNFSYGSTIEKAADNIARSAISQWKASPGHNANMLRERHRQHGVAFNIGEDGRCWGTDLFTDGPYYSTYTDSKNTSTASTAQTTEKRKRFVQAQAEAALKDRLYSASGQSKQQAFLEEAAQQHAAYLSVNRKTFGHDEVEGKRFFTGVSPEKRFKKAAGLKSKKLLKNYSLKESIASASYHIDDFEAEQAAQELLLLLNSEQKGSGSGSLVGFGISMKRSKNVITVIVVRVELIGKGG